jgi:hypothetical protein
MLARPITEGPAMTPTPTTAARHFAALLCTALLYTGLPLCAQQKRDDLTPLEISYTVSVGADLDTIRVAIDVANLRRAHTALAMPNWAPGTYFIGRYGERVRTSPPPPRAARSTSRAPTSRPGASTPAASRRCASSTGCRAATRASAGRRHPAR